MVRRIDSILAEYRALRQEIFDVIGYGKDDGDESPIILNLKAEWIGNGDILVIEDKEQGFNNPWKYTISPLGAMGETLFMGEKDGLFFFMAYPYFEDDWRQTEIIILSASKRRLDLDIDEF